MNDKKPVRVIVENSDADGHWFAHVQGNCNMFRDLGSGPTPEEAVRALRSLYPEKFQ